MGAPSRITVRLCDASRGPFRYHAVSPVKGSDFRQGYRHQVPCSQDRLKEQGRAEQERYANEILAELKVMVKEEEAGNAGTMNFGEVPGVSFAEGVKKVESMAKRTGLGFGSGGSFGSSGGGNPFGSGSGIGKNPFGSGGKGFKMPSMSMSKFKMTGWKKSSK